MVLGSSAGVYDATTITSPVTGQPATLVANGLNDVYGYDSFGNMTRYNGWTPTYNANNQVAGWPYDAAGNLLTNGLGQMVWDAESRISAVTGASYLYDAQGNRVESSGSSVTDTVYFKGRPMARLVNGQWADLIYGPMGLLAEVAGQENAEPQYRLLDHLGTQVGTTDSAQLLKNPLDYNPFGQIRSGTTSDPFFLTGKERDAESGLDYFGKRYYGSSMGRWTSPDLVNVTEERLMNPSSTLNKYAYGANNPLKYVDPDGEDITYFYDQSGFAGHAVLFAYNQATGDSAIESFGPASKSVGYRMAEPFMPVPGTGMFDMAGVKSADDLRSTYASMTIQTTPELAQQVIDFIRANPDPSMWDVMGPNCSSEVWKILKKFKLDNQHHDHNQGMTPKILWGDMALRYNPSIYGTNPQNGKDYGAPRFDMFNLMWLSLPQSKPREKVTVTIKTTDGQVIQ